MKRFSFSILAVVFLTTGCAHQRLAKQTHRQASTIADIHEQQVLDNIAKFCVNSGQVPHFALASGGSSGVSADGSTSYGLNWDNTTLTGQALGLGGSAGLSEQWSLTPVNNPEKLNLMKCVYKQVTCGVTGDDCHGCKKHMDNFFGIKNENGYSDYSCNVPSGWFSVTDCKPDNDKCCVKYGEYCGTYICVDAQYFEYLSRVTLSILDIATVEDTQLSLRILDKEKIPKTIEEEFTLPSGQVVKGSYNVTTERYTSRVQD